MPDAIDVNGQLIETFQDLMLCRHVLAADPIGWSPPGSPTHQVHKGVAAIEEGLVKLVMATAEV
jgi:hypothetical protein